MKKANLMVTLLGIIAILAIAFAFKVENSSLHFIYTGVLHSRVCTIKTLGAVIQPGTPVVAASTVPLTTNCPDEFTTITENVIN